MAVRWCIAAWRSSREGTRYGVPGMHPSMGKTVSREVFLRALEYHRSLGAAFVCPYFMALRNPVVAAANPIDAMIIASREPDAGVALLPHRAGGVSE